MPEVRRRVHDGAYAVRGSSRNVGFVCILVAWAMVGGAAQAEASLDAGTHYSHKDADCRTGPINDKRKLRYADPITAVLWGTGLRGPQRVEQILKHQVGWTPRFDALDAVQYFWDHNDCEPRNINGSNRFCECSRWHTRGRFQYHPRSGRIYYAVLTPHRDVWTKAYTDDYGNRHCDPDISGPDPGGSHYVHRRTRNGSGFDRGREKLIGKLKRTHTIERHYWRNTVTMKQCNDQLAGSNGYTAFILDGSG